jgi:hypothetical protein
MAALTPEKLHTRFIDPTLPAEPLQPRCYTLTHSDSTGDLFLTIAEDFDRQQISGWYTRLMRDEVLASWQLDEGEMSLHVHCHVSGGLVFGKASWRARILQHHMPQVIEAFHHGERALIQAHPWLDQARVVVHFHARQDTLDQTIDYGSFGDYSIEP